MCGMVSFAGFPSVFAVMKGDLGYENIPHTHPGVSGIGKPIMARLPLLMMCSTVLSLYMFLTHQVAQKEVKESVLIRFVEELDLDLSGKEPSIAKEKDRKFMGANVMHQAAAGGLTTFIKEILARGDTALLLQAKREGEEALPFQTALQKGKYATAILLLKEIKDQG